MKRGYLFILLAVVAMMASAAAPNGSGAYYSAANGYKGSALKTKLCGIIYNRTEKSYDYLWTAFQTTDKRSDGKVWDMYSNISNFTFGTDQAGSYSQEGDVYNREHSFPKSWFGGEVKPMYTDLHHMYPTDGYVNNKRANYPFGETSGNKYKSANDFSKLGNCTYPGYTGIVFEPAEEYKGDFARTYFYMVTCYEEKLADWYSNNSESRTTIDGSTYPGFQTWQLNMLLAWAAADPVSDKETARNNAVKNIQGNRNPFIDYPGLEQYIWGSKKNDSFSYDNYVQPDGSSSGSGGGGGEIGETGGEDVVEVLNVTGWGGYTTNQYCAAGVDYTGTGATTGVSYAMQVFNGSTGAVRGNQSTATENFNCRNTTTYAGYYIKEVKLTIGSSTSQIYLDGSTNGRSLVYFGSSAFTTSPSSTPTVSNESSNGRTLTWTNTDTSNNYFILYNLRTSGTTSSAKVTITWGSLTPVSKIDPSFNNLTDVNVDYSSSLTLTKGTTGTPNIVTDGSVTLESSNTDVVTVEGLTITSHAVGTALITVNITGTSTYNAGSVMFPIAINAPEGKETAAPSTTTVFTETFAGCDGKGGNDNKWNGSIASATVTVGTSTDNYGWVFAKEGGAKGCIKLGAGSGTGIATTPALGVAGTLSLSFKAGAWDYATENTTLNLSVSNGGEITPSSVELTKAMFNTYTATITNATAETKITFKSSTASNNRFFLDDVVVTKQGITLSTTLNEEGYATYCSEYPLDFSNYGTADYSAWQITGVSGTAITFEQVTGKVKGGTGILLKGEANATVTLTSTDSSNGLGSNLLYGTLAPTYVESDSYYGLSGNNFVKVNAGTVSAGKALLPASVVDGNDVKAFSFVFEEDATGINSPLLTSPKEEERVYNLAGQMVNGKLLRGIYIVNGKKIIIK